MSIRIPGPRSIWLLVALLLLACDVGRSRVSAQTFNESFLIANYLTGFAEFTRWERDTPNTVVIGVYGAPKVLRELAEMENSTDSLGPAIRSVDWNPNQSLDDIDILYISPEHRDDWTKIIVAAKQSSTLTVASDPGFLDADGLIRFIHHRNRLRFAINRDAANEYGIRFSSKLIQVAVPDEP